MYVPRILSWKNSTKPLWKHLSVTLCCSKVTQREMSFSSDVVLLLTKYCFAVSYSLAWFLPLFSEEAWTSFPLGTHEYGKVFAFFNSALLEFHRNMDSALLRGLEHLSTSDYDSQVKLLFPSVHHSKDKSAKIKVHPPTYSLEMSPFACFRQIFIFCIFLIPLQFYRCSPRTV